MKSTLIPHAMNQLVHRQPFIVKVKKVNANPAQALADTEGSRRLRLPDFQTNGT